VLKKFKKNLNHFLAVLVCLNLMLSLSVISNIYEFRIVFSQNEKLNLIKESLIFDTDLLLHQLEEEKNQLTLRKVAVSKLNMITPSAINIVTIRREK